MDIKQKTIIRAGQWNIYLDYLDYIGEDKLRTGSFFTFSELHSRLKKKAGEQKYMDVVQKFGIYEYRRFEKQITL